MGVSMNSTDSAVQRYVTEEIERLMAAEYTYAELADALGVSWRSVLNWRLGSVKPHRARSVLKRLRELQ